MNVIDTLVKTVEYAKEYSKDAKESLARNSHMNDINKDEEVDQRHIDAVLVDFINFIAGKHHIDYGMYTIDLEPNQ